MSRKKYTREGMNVHKTRREKKRLRRKIFSVVFLVMVLVVTFFVLMNRSYFFVQDVSLEGNESVPESALREHIDSYLEQKIAWWLPRKNVLLLDTPRLQRDILGTFPRIAELDVRIKDGKTLSLIIHERDAALLWCVLQDYESVFDEECYFTDHSGLFYTRAPYFSDNVFMKIFVAPEVKELAINTSFYTEDQLQAFIRFADVLEDTYDLRIHRVEFNAEGDIALSLGRLNDTLYRNAQPQIIFDQEQSYQEVVHHVGLTLDHEAFIKDFEQQASRLEKIDVRFEGRLIYKFTPLVSEE